MDLLKKVLSLIFIAACAVGSYILLTKGPCDSPLTYRIGTFDTKFGVSRETFLADAALAEKVWEDALGKIGSPSRKELFKYDPKGELPINLTYDTRQATVDKNKVISANIDQTMETVDSLKVKLAALKADYDAADAEYKSLSATYESKLAAYNQSKSRNGYAELESLRLALNAKVATVNDLARQVNAMADQYNTLVRGVNSNVAKINQSADQEFEQGEYVSDAKGQRINVYEFDGKQKLVRLLAHEMGHALGMDHNSNPQSIMYYLNNGTSLQPSAEDVAALKAACKLK